MYAHALRVPAGAFLPQACSRLGAEAIIPHDADVANAIGAVTSQVVVSKTARIRPNDLGRYAVDGLPGARDFATLADAERHAVGELERIVRSLAREARTAETRVSMATDDRIA